MNSTGKYPHGLMPILISMRPLQWSKNAVVAAAFFFAYWDREQSGLRLAEGLPRIAVAVLLFCLISSAVYLVNDIIDREADRLHLRKRFRPLASGALSVPLAATVSALLGATALGGAWLLAPEFAAVMAGYAALQAVYSLLLKRIALLDSFMIAAGFVIRAVAGALVMHVHISPWLLLCTFLLALFLALCKRRHEKAALPQGDSTQRPALLQYHAALTDQLISITAAATIVCYAIYTLWPGTVHKFGTHGLALTIPFVMFGIFRYMFLVYREEHGERPEKTLMTDRPLYITIALYALTVWLTLAAAA